LLAEELGLDPSPELQQLERDILGQAPHLTAPAAVAVPPPLEASAGRPAAPTAQPSPAVRMPASMSPDQTAASSAIERKVVTVLFAQVRDAAAILADLDPEEALERVEPALRAMADGVHRFGGTVTHVTGAGVCALFGAPRAEEDHAVRACYAALEMVDAARNATGVQIQVGCHSGEVLVRSVHSDVSDEYDAVGPAVERARLAQEVAPAGTVVASPETLRLAEGFVEVTPLQEDGTTWWVVKRPAPRTAWQVRAARGLTPRVGRGAELAILNRALERAGAGRGQVVALVGEPGVGKSRLVYEFTRQIQPSWVVEAVAASPHHTTTPYHPLVPLLRSWHPDPTADADERLPPAVRWLLGRPGDQTAGRGEPPAQRGAGTPGQPPARRVGGGTEWDELDPGVRRGRVLTALTDDILGRAGGHPLVLVVEDLHWVDGETQAVLDMLVDRMGAVPLLLLVTYRPEYEHRWANRSSYTSIHLEPLPRADARAMVRCLLGTDPSLEPLTERLAEWTGGSPLFLEETTRALVESESLAGEPGNYRLDKPLEALTIPSSVQAVLSARVDRLPERQKHVLQTASVVGAEGPISLLLDVLDAGEDDARSDLTALQAAEFLYERNRGRDVAFSFKHVLTHAAVYASLPRRRRERLHARVAAAIRARYAEPLDDQVERLAHHSLLAGSWDEAVALFREAGDRALDRSAYREAAALFEQALGALANLPPGEATTRAGIELRVRLRPALLPTGQFDRLQEHLLRAEELAEGLEDDQLLASIRIHRSYTLSARGKVTAAADVGRAALGVADRSCGSVLCAEARMAIAQADCFAGEAMSAVALLERDMPSRLSGWRFERLGMVATRSVWALGLLAASRAELGDFPAALSAAEEALVIADEVSRPMDLAFANLVAGYVLLERGDPGRAIPPLRRAHEVGVEADLRLVSSWVRARLGLALASTGALDEAAEVVGEALESSIAQSVPLTEIWCRQALAMATLAAGVYDQAERHVARILELAGAERFRYAEASALRLQARMLLCRQPVDHDGAERRLREALRLAADLRARPEMARCRLELSTVLARAGRSDDADRELRAATAQLRSLGIAGEHPPAGAP
jgi:class 3 adenylate cyclase/tetratricopeptide (TPR) repeat protein